ncbi:MAG: RidA family protein [Hydrogenophilaceae bacterium]|jgi:enamine deaminase RidA (YjgF/YER057c/UK114 family)|nr:RidA family protein [Hydrogenophilaceae bacterium]
MKTMQAVTALALLAASGGCVSIEDNSPAQGPAPVREAIVPPGWEEARDVLHYSPALRSGDFVFLSGVVAGLREGEEGEAGMTAAFDRAFRALGGVLAAAGADWDDVVEMTTYHTDLPAQIAAFAAVKDRYIREPYPAWTAIDIDRLYPDNGVVEIKLTARIAPDR